MEDVFELDPSRTEVIDALERIHRKSDDWDALRSLFESALDATAADEPNRAGLSARFGDLLLNHFNAAVSSRRSLHSSSIREAMAAIHTSTMDLINHSADGRGAKFVASSRRRTLPRSEPSIIKHGAKNSVRWRRLKRSTAMAAIYARCCARSWSSIARTRPNVRRRVPRSEPGHPLPNRPGGYSFELRQCSASDWNTLANQHSIEANTEWPREH